MPAKCSVDPALAKCSVDPAPTNILGQPVGVSANTSFVNPKKARSTHHLLSDVKLMMEPISDIKTAGIDNNQGCWWEHKSSTSIPNCPNYTCSSTSRYDFQFRGSGVEGNKRHSSNPNKTPASGIGEIYDVTN